MIKRLITNSPFFSLLIIILMFTSLRAEVSAATCPLPQILQNNVCTTPTAAASPQTMARILTVLGVIDIQLSNSAPLTVANFLTYVGSGAYQQSFFHRIASGPGLNIIQGGGFTWNANSNTYTTIPTLPPVVNEFSLTRSNVRGTIAMAKVSGNADSATDQWFINLADDSANLDAQNGGFTVFGQVVGSGLAVADAIAALPTINAGGTFTNLPLATPVSGSSISTSNLVMVSSITSNSLNATASTSDRLFSYLEATYPTYISPANPLAPNGTGSSILAGYYYRYYAATNSYVAAMDGNVYYLGTASNNQIILLGSLASWFSLAVAAGY
jgi:cyclophilin family peptidyl-prolyl cis-trans isomerase